MNNRSRSTLFLMEQLIVIIVFAIYASVCVKIFAVSFLMVNDTRDMNHALVVAKNAAEISKVYGDTVKTIAILGGHEYNNPNATQGVVYYDKKWQICDEAKAAFALSLNALPEDSENNTLLLLYKLSVEKISIERIREEMISFTMSARSGRAQGGNGK